MTIAASGRAGDQAPFAANAFRLDPGIRLLEASAGTGKTFALAHLVLRLVGEAGHRLRSLLVVTFTEAAAAELRDRIASRLQQALSGLEDRPDWTPPDSVLASWLAQYPEPAERRRLQGRLLLALEELDGADITTIHGFCRRTLARQALQAGLPPQLPLETDPELLLSQVIHDYWQQQVLALPLPLLAGLQRAGLSPEALREVLRQADADPALTLDPLPDGVRSDRSLAELLPALWQNWLERFLELWQDQGQELHAALCAAAQHWRDLGHSKTGDYVPKPRKNRVAELQTWLAGHGGAPGYEAVRDQKLLTGFFHPGGFSQQARKVEGDSRQPSLPQPALMQAIADLVDGPAELVLRHACHWGQGQLLARRQRAGVVSFSQLLAALDPGVQALQPTPLLEAVAARYRVALIDEFQDTDPVQWRILRLAFGRGEHLLVMVGDPKQAIYRFRGGDLPTYLEARDQADACLGLRQNRRSSPALIDALNGLMAGPAAASGRGLERSGLEVPVVEAAADLDTVWADPPAGPEAAAPAFTTSSQASAQRDGRAGRQRRSPAGAEASMPAAAPSDPVAAEAAAAPTVGAAALSATPTGEAGAVPPITLLWLGGERAAGEPLPSRTTLEAELPGRIAAAVTRLLGQGVVLRQGSQRRPLRRADLCILVSTHDQAERLRSALERRGLASRLVSKADVFASPAALALQRLLDALADPADQGRLRLLAASPLLAWSAARIATTSADGWSDLAGELERLARRLGSSGPIGVINALLDSEALARLAVGGRLLADLQQLAMLVQERLHADQLGPAAAADWLRRLRLDEDRLVPEEHQAHSDRADGAISVVTVHRSKGLEFPVVFCPYLWQAPSPGNQRLALRWQPGGSAAPRLSLQVDRRWGDGWQAACQSLQAEEAERERLAYVAMTRARHLLVLAWGPAAEQGSNPLQSWLLPSAGLGDGGGSGSGRACSDDEWRQAIAETIAERRLPISFEEAPASDDPVQAPAEARSAAEWHVGPVPQRRLDSLWGRSSYTSWTQGRHGLAQDPANREAGRDTADPAVDLELPPAAGVTTSAASAAGELGRRGAVATAPQLAAGAAACAAPGQVASTPERADGSPGDGDSAGPAPWLQNGPLAAFPRGSGAGDCLHRILEQVDYQRPLASEDNRQVAQRELRRAGFADQPLEPLLDGLERLRHTPFGGALGDWRLAGLPRCQRLNELAFDLTLSLVRAADLAAVFSAHPGGGCDAAYGQRLAQLPVESCGFLTGSIDLTCPIPAAGGQPRWWVIDWKSNWLGERDAQGQPRACGPRHYAQAAMAELMRSNHYHLQAHLYLVALHRYLRWRLPDYAPQRHLGGYAYVFLRGVPGPLAAVAPGEAIPGIYQDSPPLERLLALDALFGGAR